MQHADLINCFSSTDKAKELHKYLQKNKQKIHLSKLSGSAVSLYLTASVLKLKKSLVLIANTHEESAYYYNDFSGLLKDNTPVYHYPASNKIPYEVEEIENANIAIRAEVLQALQQEGTKIIITYPEAISENVISKQELKTNSVELALNTIQDVDFINDVLVELEFVKVDYVSQPGQFSIRGGIVDVFSFANEYPFRVEIFGDELESIRSFDPVSQLSIKNLSKISIVPNIVSNELVSEYVPFINYLADDTFFALEDLDLTINHLDKYLENANKKYGKLKSPVNQKFAKDLFQSGTLFSRCIIWF